MIRWGLKFTFLGLLLTAGLIWLSRPTSQTASHEGQTLTVLVAARAQH